VPTLNWIGKEAVLFGRVVILPIIDPVTPAIEAVFQLRGFLHVEEKHAHAETFPLASSRRVVAEFVRIVYSLGALLANLLAFLGLAVLPAGEGVRRERLKIWLQR